MANTTKAEKKIKEVFINNCWKYLHDNFHKFNQSNQIKIALELVKKNIPQVIEGEVKYVSMEIIKIEQKPLNLVVGELPDSVKQRIAK